MKKAFSLLVFGVCLGAVANAQPVPDLKPNELEIRSKKPIELPKLERPPISTLVTPPRAYMPPDGRMPYLGQYKQRPTELPHPGLIDAPTEGRQVISVAKPHHLMLKASLGRFLTREIDGALDLPLNENTDATAKLNYLGSDGATPFTDRPTVRSTFNDLEGMAGLRQTWGKTQGHLQVGGFWNHHVLFGADTANVVGPKLLPQPIRRGTGFATRFEVQSLEQASIPFKVGVSYGLSSFKTELLEDISSLFTSKDKPLDFMGEVGYQFPQFEVFAHGHLNLTALNSKTIFGSDQLFTQLKAGANFRINDQLCFTIGGQFAGFDLSARNTGNAAVSKNFFSPVFRGDYYFPNHLHVYLANDPKTQAHSLASLFKTNPYLTYNPVLQPNIETTRFQAGVNKRWDKIATHGFAGYSYSPSFLYFEPTRKAQYVGYKQGIYEAFYGSSDQFFFGGDVAYNMLGNLATHASLLIRNGRLLNKAPAENAVIPNMSPFTATASASYRFLNQKGLIAAQLQIESSKYGHQNKATKAPAFIDLDLEGSYQLFPQYAVFAQIKNIGTNPIERLVGYPESRFIPMAGIKSTFKFQ